MTGSSDTEGPVQGRLVREGGLRRRLVRVASVVCLLSFSDLISGAVLLLPLSLGMVHAQETSSDAAQVVPGTAADQSRLPKNTDAAIEAWAKIAGQLTAEFDTAIRAVRTGTKHVTAVANVIDVMNGDALVLGAVQKNVRADTAKLEAMHHYENTMITLPEPIMRRLESPIHDLAMGEYDRVIRAADAQIEEIENALAELDAEALHFETIEKHSRQAEENGLAAEASFKELAGTVQGRALQQIDALWLDLAHPIGLDLAARTNAIVEGRKRIKVRKEFLQGERLKAERIRNAMAFGQWWEIFYESAKPQGAYSSALEEAQGIAGTLSASQVARTAEIAMQNRIANAGLRREVARLMGEAANADNDAAKAALLQKILALVGATAQAVETFSQPSLEGEQGNRTGESMPGSDAPSNAVPQPAPTPAAPLPKQGQVEQFLTRLLQPLPDAYDGIASLWQRRYGVVIGLED